MADGARLPATRRIVTDHSPSGKAIIISDDQLTPANPLDPNGGPPTGIIPGFTNVFKTEGHPAKVQGEWKDYHGKMVGLTDQSGVVCRIVDFPPTHSSSDQVNIMHRTQSIDYGIILNGTIDLVLDDGVQTTMKVGDIVVQRGTIHHWNNVSGEVCRVLFVLVPAEPVKVEETGLVLQSTDTKHLEE